jgi:hypothetical protein
MTLADLVIKSYDQTLTREQRGEYYRQAVEMAKKELAKPKRAKKTDTPEGFDEWYKHYPHKVARGYAEKAYAHARGIATQEQLIKGANWYSRNKPEETPWAHPASWLNAKRWLDGQADSVLVESLNILMGTSGWPDWKKELAEKIGETQTATWFKNVTTEFNSAESGVPAMCYLTVPSVAVHDWIKARYSKQLYEVLGHHQIIVAK